MKKTINLSALLLSISLLSGCSGLSELLQPVNDANPLKTVDDQRIERVLLGGKWLYQRQADDCADTYWAQHFYKNGYYKSGGASCLLSDSFSVDAENWHIKNQVLYIMNLSPKQGEDIILKYGVALEGRNKLILRSATNTYTFIRSWE